MLVDNIHFNAIEKPSGFMVPWTKPRNHETWRLLDIPEMNWMKPWNLMTSRCPRDGVDETTKPRNHETWRLLDVPEMDWVKPRNHETTKPWNLTAYQCPRDGLDETVKPWNLTSSQCLRDGLDETMKPRNHETMKPDVFSMSQRWIGHGVDETTKPVDFSPSRDGEDETTKPRNHETMKPVDFSSSRDEVDETMKPWNHETTKPIVISMSQRWSGRNHETMLTGFLVSWSARRDKSWNQKPWNLRFRFQKRAMILPS